MKLITKSALKERVAAFEAQLKRLQEAEAMQSAKEKVYSENEAARDRRMKECLLNLAERIAPSARTPEELSAVANVAIAFATITLNEQFY